MTIPSMPKFEDEARDLLAAIHRRDPDACARVKWEHPVFRGMSFAEMASVDPTSLTDDDARMMVARHHALASWFDLTVFVSAVEQEPEVSRFERAADAVVTGEAEVLRDLLSADPGLVHARSLRTHHATLLHYVAANGVEESRQRTPPNAVAIATLLLDAGADPNARADMYDEPASTMQMLVSSAHPAQAGVQADLAETLLAYGATLDTAGTREPSSVRMALAFGYLDTARRLATRLSAINDLIIAAGLGLDDDTRRLLRDAGSPERHRALALATAHGHTAVVRMLLEAGEDPNRFNPEGYHSHATPLHQAALANHPDVVETLLEHGARLETVDTVFGGTPLDWAAFANHHDMVRLLRERGGREAKDHEDGDDRFGEDLGVD